MAGQSPADLSTTGTYYELEQAVQDLSTRGLHTAARWAAEQLAGLDPAVQQLAANSAVSGSPPPLNTDPTDRHPQYILARQHFEFREYKRAAHVLAGVPGPKALFLRSYSTYLAGEKRREEEIGEKGGALGSSKPAAGQSAALGTGSATLPGPPTVAHTGPSGPPNQELDALEGELRGAYNGGGADAFCVYLLGLVLLDKQRVDEATELLLMSLRSYPCNWAAWLALQRAVVGGSPGSKGPLASGHGGLLPQHWARDAFLASTALETQENMEALSRLQSLSQVFPHSLGVEAQVAQAHYNLQNYEDAAALFEDLLTRDPYRLEGMDTYSNILFVREQSAALSHLAHRAVETDKFRPETCCIVGNYYSLKGSHERAVAYFRRALRLQRTYLAAWTLMGHEYMELKHTPAAIEAYRHAVDLSPSDFRAWYGLGQAYELLKMPYYALYYYRRAAALRPGDARMWCALGQCYASEQVGNRELAMRAYQRAIDAGDPDGIAMHLLAGLCEAAGDLDGAENLYRANLARLERDVGGAVPGAAPPPVSALGSDAVDALLFLAARCKDTGRLSEAGLLCERLLDVGGPAKERAKALGREVAAMAGAARMAAGAAGGHQLGLGGHRH